MNSSVMCPDVCRFSVRRGFDSRALRGFGSRALRGVERVSGWREV